MKEKIYDELFNNRIINEYFSKINIQERDEFRQFIYEIIVKMVNDEEKFIKLQKLYDKNELGKYIVGIINNQLKSNTSPYYLFYKKHPTVEYNLEYENEVEEIYEQDDTDERIDNLLKVLNTIYITDQILFKLYYGICPKTNKVVKPMTFKEVGKLIGINYQSIRASVNKTKEKIKCK